MTNQYSLLARVLYFRISGTDTDGTEMNYKNTAVNMLISSRRYGVVKEADPAYVFYLRTELNYRVTGCSAHESGLAAGLSVGLMDR